MEYGGWDESVYFSEPYLIYFDGKALMRLDVETGIRKKLDLGDAISNVSMDHIMIYDLDTGKISEVGQEELAYQVLYPISGFMHGDE